MGYERPMIVRRDPVRALLEFKSDQNVDEVPSDVRVKENVVAVAW